MARFGRYQEVSGTGRRQDLRTKRSVGFGTPAPACRARGRYSAYRPAMQRRCSWQTSSSPRASIGVAPPPPTSLRALGTWTAAVLPSTTTSWAAATRNRVRLRSTSTPTASIPTMTASISTITTRRTSRCLPRWASTCSACPSPGAVSSPTAMTPSPTRPASPSTIASSTACAPTTSSRS